MLDLRFDLKVSTGFFSPSNRKDRGMPPTRLATRMASPIPGHIPPPSPGRTGREKGLDEGAGDREPVLIILRIERLARPVSNNLHEPVVQRTMRRQRLESIRRTAFGGIHLFIPMSAI
jgi:hypothetical protein